MFTTLSPKVTRKSGRSSCHSSRSGHKCPEEGSNSTRGVNHSVKVRSNGTFTYVRNGCRSVRSRAISRNSWSSGGSIVSASFYSSSKSAMRSFSSCESNAYVGIWSIAISSSFTFHCVKYTSRYRHIQVFVQALNPSGVYSPGNSLYRGARNCTSCNVFQLRAAQGTNGISNPKPISSPARISFIQSVGRHHFATSTNPAANSSSGVSGRTRVPNPTTIPASSHGFARNDPARATCAPPTSVCSSTRIASAVRKITSVSVSTTAVYLAVNGHSAASHNPASATRRRELSGASRAAINAITKHVTKSTTTCDSMAARGDCPATANTAARNAGYPGTRISTGVSCPCTANPYTPFFNQFHANSM